MRRKNVRLSLHTRSVDSWKICRFQLVRDGLFRTQVQVQRIILGRGDAHTQVASAARSDGHQTSRFEAVQDAAQGVAADVELLHETSLRRKPVSRLESQVLNDLPELFQSIVLLSHVLPSLHF
jgi:hypothetical protein